MTEDGLITVSIVEDDPHVRHSLSNILNGSKGIKCIGEYADAEEALREIPSHLPNVVLMDINLPHMDGVRCVGQLREVAPSAHIIMLTVHDDADAIFNSLAGGATGYLLKPVRTADLLAAVKDVNSGGAPMTSHIARKVVQSFKQAGPAAREAEGLSPREAQILNYLAKGYLYKEVADMLTISYATVHKHIEHIYDKLHVFSRAQAVAKFHRL